MQDLLQRIGATSDATKGTLLALHFKKKSYLGFFKNFFGKKVLCALGHIFNKGNTGIVQKPDAVGTQNWLGR